MKAGSTGARGGYADVVPFRPIPTAATAMAGRSATARTRRGAPAIASPAPSPIEAVATTLALRDRVAPPTLNWAEPDEGLDLDYVADGTRPLVLRDGKAPIAISNSFGFGGHNAVLVLEGT